MSLCTLDRLITIFSPAGRLYQVEFAAKAVNRDNRTMVAIAGVDCVVLVVQRKPLSKYAVTETANRIFRISDVLGCAVIGRQADCKSHVHRALQEACVFQHRYGYPIAADVMCQRLADINQVYTHDANIRPLACSIVLISYDLQLGPLIYNTDPTGVPIGYRACVFGSAMQRGNYYVDSVYKYNMSKDETVKLAIRTLAFALDKELRATDFEMAMVTQSNPYFHILTESEINTQLIRMTKGRKRKRCC
ncbi:proteasome subunit alpha type-6 [Drosophila mojavensis]|uniref:Proteasome alpha-type subunits domain-containing protein n=1 Tax=Drosophila mojavensis TaxID=7230 RepID=B4L735_DROMO|nr:proteasome subunit alpha type-6 [Drosophila mojavensis]EDW06181.1 uncharacterized protein Dmoj_GI16051 [Drosophila mojavensis]